MPAREVFTSLTLVEMEEMTGEALAGVGVGVGAGGTITVSVADCEAEPPAPEHVRVKRADVLREPVA